MLHPSYTDLMKVVNSEVEPGEAPVVNSRYSIVMATAKRARQLIAGDEPLVAGAAGKKPRNNLVFPKGIGIYGKGRYQYRRNRSGAIAS